MIDTASSFIQSRNPLRSLWDFNSNFFRMSHYKMTRTLAGLLGVVVVIVGILAWGALRASFIRGESLAFFAFLLSIPVVPFLFLLVPYLITLRGNDAYKLRALSISDTGIDCMYKGHSEFLDFSRIQKMTFNRPNFIQEITADLTGLDLLGTMYAFDIFYALEVGKPDGTTVSIKIPLNIKHIDRGIALIASRLPQDRVNIGFENDKPTVSYYPGFTSPGFANKALPWWVLPVTLFLFIALPLIFLYINLRLL